MGEVHRYIRELENDMATVETNQASTSKSAINLFTVSGLLALHP